MNSALQSGSLPHRSPATGHGPLTPVFATLTSRPQITENPTTLSPFLATHTKTTGVYTNSSQNGTRRLRRKGTPWLYLLHSAFCLLPSTLPLATISPCLHPIPLRIANFSPPPPIPARVSTASSPPIAP